MDDYKEKYEMALETVQEILDSGTDSIKMSRLKLRLQSVFPELKEPSDEKIREVLIDYYKVGAKNGEQTSGIEDKYILAWLEKQGEQKPQGKSILDIWKSMRLEVYQQASGNRHEPNYSDDNTKMFSLNDVDEIIEKMNEQKPVEPIEEFKDDDGLYSAIDILEKTLGAVEGYQTDDGILEHKCAITAVRDLAKEKREQKQDPCINCKHPILNCGNFPCAKKRAFKEGKSISEVIKDPDYIKVEPKFKVGDWVITNNSEKRLDLIPTLYIVDSNETSYSVEDIYGGSGCPRIEYLENHYHLWSIQDAKDGDILSYVTDEGDLWIMKYQSLYEPYEGCVHYHTLLVNDNLTGKGTCSISIDNLKPATKEQRDILFQEIKHAASERIFDKKEPKKL